MYICSESSNRSSDGSLSFIFCLFFPLTHFSMWLEVSPVCLLFRLLFSSAAAAAAAEPELAALSLRLLLLSKRRELLFCWLYNKKGERIRIRRRGGKSLLTKRNKPSEPKRERGK